VRRRRIIAPTPPSPLATRSIVAGSGVAFGSFTRFSIGVFVSVGSLVSSPGELPLLPFDPLLPFEPLLPFDPLLPFEPGFPDELSTTWNGVNITLSTPNEVPAIVRTTIRVVPPAKPLLMN
jgi:hypothetical protein